jgi:hypothetical protein
MNRKRHLWICFICMLSAVMAGCKHSRENAVIHDKKSRDLDIAAINKMSDDKVDDAAREVAQSQLNSAQGENLEAVRSTSKGIQMYLGTTTLEDEVNNGGFNQFYWNSSGQFAQMALEGYRLIGAREHEKLVARAIDIHKAEEPTIREFKDAGTTESFSASYKHTQLNPLDQQFFDLEHKENTASLRAKYVRTHTSEFLDQ